LKIDIKQIQSGEEELILRYIEKTPRVQRILEAIQGTELKLIGKKGSDTVTLNPSDILYIESVDERIFAYTKGDVIRLDGTLYSIMEQLSDVRFFRCSKSMIINVEKVERLKSISSNRIDATMEGGEHILISRTYASDFRRLLRRNP
jgi:DNA-binding LytR/AlgR family response regulator